MSNEELIKCARAIKNRCKDGACDNCPFLTKSNHCGLWDVGSPDTWDLPEVGVGEGHYEYGIFDGEGNLVGSIWTSKVWAEIRFSERKARNPNKGYCLKKRLITEWEQVEGES